MRLEHHAMLRNPEQCPKPYCPGPTHVLASRPRPGYRWRRHACTACGAHWSSFQVLVHPADIDPQDVADELRQTGPRSATNGTPRSIC